MSFRLNTGHNIPLVGFGTYTINGNKQTKLIMDQALSVGYRLFDTAKMYSNEAEIGKALKDLLPKHNLTRKDVFITTKLYPSDQGDVAYDAFQESLKKLDCEYIDLFLIHWPGTWSQGTEKPSKLRDRSWQLMAKAYQEGLVKNIGVSNYTVKHLKELLANDHGVKPTVNQIEWHPYYHPQDVYDFCKEQNILLQAYMPLGSGSKHLLNDKVVSNVAKELGKTNAQILLKWSVQQGVGVIPRTISEQHMKENFDLNFTIPDKHMQMLSNMNKTVKYDWDPETVP
ncbi:uncharacterized protein LOC115883883 [Sitophilus oryzae]|uniref:Uncharacterized protein LOC115883883 n=1 Tax=Sitophilus oryzae TaxID=7048 RepID=A0A6J2Y4G1_SITOR|nr:uncharacterized protein LOC115883883 [Sitophilus oryzae]